MSGPSAERFDKAFADAAESAWLRRVFGEDLPPEIEPHSFVTLEALELFARELGLRPGRLLVDLACGRGGPGLWLARRAGPRLIGVDFSPVGVRHASARAEGVDASFLVADAASTGLEDGLADALVCIDAIQLMPHPAEVAREIARLLRPGARAGFTTWEREDRLPDLNGILEAASLAVVLRQQREDWLARELRIFQRAIDEAPGLDDPAVSRLAEEGSRAVPALARSRRIVVIAEKRS